MSWLLVIILQGYSLSEQVVLKKNSNILIELFGFGINHEFLKVEHYWKELKMVGIGMWDLREVNWKFLSWSVSPEGNEFGV